MEQFRMSYWATPLSDYIQNAFYFPIPAFQHKILIIFSPLWITRNVQYLHLNWHVTNNRALDPG